MRIGELLHTMDKVTIAMMRGPAIGAGLSIALACDLRFADSTAKFRTGFLPLALPGDHGGHYYLPRIVGAAKARELYLLSPTLDAAQALHIGLATQVTAPEELEPLVMRIAAGLAQGPAGATAQMKRNLNDGLCLPLGELLDAEARRHVSCAASDEHREAVQAFLQKRSPRFRH
jgi:2-(1,2-epoxy-1,2-dihydrophenyl)acetyl-CoA isomerase